MSQMYAIKNPSPGDQTIAEWLDEELEPRGVRVFGLAAPNLNNEEAVMYLIASTTTPEVSASAFVYGLCFDKLRNVDLRPGLKKFLFARPALKEAWMHACDRELATRHPMACEKMKASLAKGEELAKTAEDSTNDGLEQKTRTFAADLLPLVADRQYLNAEFQQAVYLLRNRMLGIRSTTKRPIIESRYELNKEFIELLIDLAERSKVTLLLYVIPLNPSGENPYIAEQYAAFKTWIESLASRRGVGFANLENVVPAEDWESVDEGPDFKHFKGAGHRATAQALLGVFGPTLRNLGRTRVAHDALVP
jgi:hypothetical protein